VKKQESLDTPAKQFQAMKSRTICWKNIGQLTKVRRPRSL